jgi:hypothetical protein
MKNNIKFNDIEAMLPVYVKDKGNCTEIITRAGSFIKTATIETCTKKLADYFNISLYHNRINYVQDQLGAKFYADYPIYYIAYKGSSCLKPAIVPDKPVDIP